jgi:hypothetical protein
MTLTKKEEKWLRHLLKKKAEDQYSYPLPIKLIPGQRLKIEIKFYTEIVNNGELTVYIDMDSVKEAIDKTVLGDIT